MLSSDLLFHYTKDFDTLTRILKSKSLIPYPNIESYLFLGKDLYNDFLFGGRNHSDIENQIRNIQMVCFCDIPVALSANHMKVYGKFAIAFKKKWGIVRGVNPVFYVASEIANPATYIKALISGLESLEEDKRGPLYQNVERLMCYLKPYEGPFRKVPDLGDQYRFYDEREWRYIPPLPDLYNTPSENRLKFELAEVELIVVESENQKERLFSELNFSSKFKTKVATHQDITQL